MLLNNLKAVERHGRKETHMKFNINIDEQATILNNAWEIIDTFMSMDLAEAKSKYPAIYKKAITQLSEYYEMLVVYLELLRAIKDHKQWFSPEYISYISQAIDDMVEVLYEYKQFLDWSDIAEFEVTF